MVEWDENQHAIMRSYPRSSHRLVGITHNVLMAEHDTLWQPVVPLLYGSVSKSSSENTGGVDA